MKRYWILDVCRVAGGKNDRFDCLTQVLSRNTLMATLQGSNIVGAYEGKTHLSARLEKVEAGEEFTITKHGAPVAKPVPVKKQASPEERVAAIGRTQMLASALSLRGLRVKDLTSEGRG